MRLIDADKCFAEDPYYYDNEYDKYTWDLICSQPTVEAIPIEQVAELLHRYAGSPCNYASFDNEFCDNCERNSKIDCWLHALREGWLDEE